MPRAGLLLIPTLTLLSSAALAQPAPTAAVRLDYQAPEGCPDERELRSVVASRMGHDPFASAQGPALNLEVRVARRPGGFAGTVELREPDGRVIWSRPPLSDPDCQRLVSVLGGVSIRAAIDTAPALPAAPPVLPPQAPPRVEPSAPAAPSPAPAFRLGARAGLAVGMLPRPAALVAADVGVGWQYASIALEGLAALPVERDVDAGVRLRSSLLAGSIVPCGHYRWFTGCAVVSVGAFRAEGVNLDTPARSTGVYVAAGVRAALEWPVLSFLALRLAGDVLVNLHPLTPEVQRGATPADAERVEVWRSGPFTAVLGAGVVLRFGGAPAPPAPANRVASIFK